MSLQIAPVKRVFQYQGMQLPDIDPELTPEEIRDVYSAQYGELTTAQIIDAGVEEGVHRYEFQRKVGEKG